MVPLGTPLIPFPLINKKIWRKKEFNLKEKHTHREGIILGISLSLTSRHLCNELWILDPTCEVTVRNPLQKRKKHVPRNRLGHDLFCFVLSYRECFLDLLIYLSESVLDRWRKEREERERERNYHWFTLQMAKTIQPWDR